MNSDAALAFLQTEYNKALVKKDLVASLKSVKKEAGKYKKVINKKDYKLFMNGITEAIQEFDTQIKRENLLSNDPFKELTTEEWRGYV